MLFPCYHCPGMLLSHHHVVQHCVGVKSWWLSSFGQVYVAGLVSMASGDLHPVPKMILKLPRELGRSAIINKGWVSTNASENCKHSPRTLQVCSSKCCPYFPSACYVFCENVKRSFDEQQLKQGLGSEEHLVGVALDQMNRWLNGMVS